MRFFRACSPSRGPSFLLGLPHGNRKVTVRLQGGQLQLCLNSTGEILEAHPLEAVSWHTCVLPSKEHGLCLRVSDAAAKVSTGTEAARELLLRCKDKERVEEVQAQLCAASLGHEQQLRRHGAPVERGKPGAEERRGRPAADRGSGAAAAQPEVADMLQLFLAAPSQRLSPQQLQPLRQQQERDASGPEDSSPSPRSISFGSLVAEEFGDTESGSSGSGSSTSNDSQPLGFNTSGSASSSSTSSPRIAGSQCGEEGGDRWQGLPRGLPGAIASPRRLAPLAAMPESQSAPASPVLPGLAVVLNRAADPAHRASASAPVSPAHAKVPHGRTSAAAAAAVLPEWETRVPAAPPMPPVRLLSFSGREIGGGTGQSHVQRLEAAVARLSADLAQSRLEGACGIRSRPTSPSKPQAPKAQEAGPTSAQQPPDCRAASSVLPQGGTPASAHEAALAPAGGTGSCRTNGNASRAEEQLELVLRENTLLLQQQQVLQAQLGRMQGQLAAAAADNIHLAQEASAAVRQLQVAAEAASGGQLRERQLRASLEAAAGHCEVVGRELAVLSRKLEAKSAQYQELKSTVEALSRQRIELTAALTIAQLQLKEATPVGWAAEAAELRRQAETARSDAAQAKAAAAAAEAKLAAAQCKEAEAAGHMREAAQCMEAAGAAREVGLQREQQLAAEVRSLRQQLAGWLPDVDPATALQERVSQLEAAHGHLVQERAALVSQVQQLSAVGQELSGSCRALEVSRKAAAQERDELQSALSQLHAEHSAAEQRWEQQRQQLEASLGTANVRLAGSEDSTHSSRAQMQALQGRVEGLQRELQQAQQRAAAREQELQGELKLLAAKAEVEGKAARERREAEATAQGAQAARQQELARAQEAELAAAHLKVAVLAAEQQREQEEARRGCEERAAEKRELQLEASAAKADAAKLAQDLNLAQGTGEELRQALEDAKRAVQQAQAQAAAATVAQSSLSQERKELLARLERMGVERDRAIRDRDTQQYKCAALQQQCKLLEAVTHRQAVPGRGGGGARRGGSKENGGRSWDPLIKAHRPVAAYASSSD